MIYVKSKKEIAKHRVVDPLIIIMSLFFWLYIGFYSNFDLQYFFALALGICTILLNVYFSVPSRRTDKTSFIRWTITILVDCTIAIILTKLTPIVFCISLFILYIAATIDNSEIYRLPSAIICFLSINFTYVYKFGVSWDYFFVSVMLAIINLLVWAKTDAFDNQLNFEKKLQDENELIKSMQGELIKKEKMASLGKSLAGITHELNTPIGVAYSDSHYLKEQIAKLKINISSGNTEGVNKILSKITESASDISSCMKRAGEIVNNIKLISVDQKSERKRNFNIIDYINTIVKNLKHEIKNIEVSIEGEDIQVFSYPGPFSQIVTNLIMNAKIHAFSNEITKPKVNIFVKKENSGISIEFKDNGLGIRDINVNNIFDPFVTSKSGSGGSGLGLSIVQSIVEKVFKGKISCESEPGNGTVFSIYIQVD